MHAFNKAQGSGFALNNPMSVAKAINAPGMGNYVQSQPNLNAAINEVIVGSTWSVAVSQGSDASPSSHLIGGPFLSSPTITSQQIGGLVSGVTYIVMATVVTSAGNTLELWSHIPCIAPF